MRRALFLLPIGGILLGGGCQALKSHSGTADKANAAVEKKDASAEAMAAAKPAQPNINASTRLSAGRMFEAEGNMPAAIEQYRGAFEADPNNVEAYTRMGVACMRVQRFEEATRAFLRAIEIAPDKAYLHNNLGFCYILQENFEDAEKSFRNAIALRPDYQRAHMNLGTVLAHTGRQDEAVQEFEKGVPRDAAFYNLGLILASNKQYDAAEQAFRHSLDLNPGSRDATAQIARLASMKTAAAAPPPAAAVASARGSSNMALSAAPAGSPAPSTQPAFAIQSATPWGTPQH